MNAGSQKRIASEILKCGLSRVRIRQTEAVEEALTREDIRGLIQSGDIWAEQKKGRKRGDGRRKGTKGARKNDKTKWIEKVRPLRSLLSDLKAAEQISIEDYGILYRRVKGGFFRNRNHLMFYIKDNEMLKKGITKKEAMAKIKKARPRAVSKAKPVAKKAKATKKRASKKTSEKKPSLSEPKTPKKPAKKEAKKPAKKAGKTKK
jgi:large subunit ribosomal protein L19e